jgi:hypothetical protein
LSETIEQTSAFHRVLCANDSGPIRKYTGESTSGVRGASARPLQKAQGAGHPASVADINGMAEAMPCPKPDILIAFYAMSGMPREFPLSQSRYKTVIL